MVFTVFCGKTKKLGLAEFGKYNTYLYFLLFNILNLCINDGSFNIPGWEMVFLSPFFLHKVLSNLEPGCFWRDKSRRTY